MVAPKAPDRNEALRALISLVLIEGAALAAVVFIYLHTDNLVYLIGGVLGVVGIFLPLQLRRIIAHRDAAAQKPNSTEEGEP